MTGNVSRKSGMQPIQKMENSRSGATFKSSFHCGWEWHFRKQSRACLLIYALASRVTATNGKPFWASAASIALSYGLSKDTVYRAIRTLCKLGFFELLGKYWRGTNEYRVLSHEEWVRKHPGQCAVYQRSSRADSSEPSSELTLPGEASAYPYAAPARLAEDAAVGDSTNPDAVALARELTYASDGAVTFTDKHRMRLAEVLNEFSAQEVKSAFTNWLDEQDLSDPKNVSFLPGKFVQIVDGLCYSAQKRKQQSEKTKAERAVMVAKIQAEAEEERRLEAEAKAKEEEFDPLL